MHLGKGVQLLLYHYVIVHQISGLTSLCPQNLSQHEHFHDQAVTAFLYCGVRNQIRIILEFHAERLAHRDHQSLFVQLKMSKIDSADLYWKMLRSTNKNLALRFICKFTDLAVQGRMVYGPKQSHSSLDCPICKLHTNLKAMFYLLYYTEAYD